MVFAMCSSSTKYTIFKECKGCIPACGLHQCAAASWLRHPEPNEAKYMKALVQKTTAALDGRQELKKNALQSLHWVQWLLTLHNTPSVKLGLELSIWSRAWWEQRKKTGRRCWIKQPLSQNLIVIIILWHQCCWVLISMMLQVREGGRRVTKI